MLNKNLFGERVKEIRINNNLQQADLAEILQITKQAISNVEKGRNAFSIDVLYHFCKHFNVSADYLLGLDNNEE